MAWRLQEHVIRGEIDNRIRGRLTGHIWLAGVEQPLVLDLEGNCSADLAGCFLTFENRAPVPLENQPPVARQRGRVGEITASRKVRVPDVPIEEFLRLRKAGLPAPEHLANSLYIEWFSKLSGRVVIESTDFELHVSPPEWRLPPEQGPEQMHETDEDITGFLETPSEAFVENEADEIADGPWDEFRHEQALRESEALTEKFGKLLEKYRNHPERDRIIAQEMGWQWVDDALDEQSGAADLSEEADVLEETDEEFEQPQPEPNPEREGIDWIRTPDGEIRHPLQHRAFELVASLDAFCKERGLLQDADADLVELISLTAILTGKLAGALSDLAEGTDLYEPGFVVALLKRALEVLNEALSALEALAEKPVLPREKIATVRFELLSVREGMLTLIQYFRGQIS
ncbi:hypothetical protein ACXR0O_10440 [Verrucomicrobiota bacterium sgz303538]